MCPVFTRDMADAFSTIVGRLDYPMFVATTIGAGGERAGCLVGFATQASIDPQRFLVCISDKNRTYRIAREADVLAVHLVPVERDHDPRARSCSARLDGAAHA